MQSTKIEKNINALNIKVTFKTTYPELSGLKSCLPATKVPLHSSLKSENNLVHLIMDEHWEKLNNEMIKKGTLFLTGFLYDDSLFTFLPKEILGLISLELANLYAKEAEKCFRQQCKRDVNPLTKSLLQQNDIFKPQTETDVYYDQAFFKKSAFLSKNEPLAIENSDQKIFDNK